jgi:hypothetical protein
VRPRARRGGRDGRGRDGRGRGHGRGRALGRLRPLQRAQRLHQGGHARLLARPPATPAAADAGDQASVARVEVGVGMRVVEGRPAP